MSLEMMLGIAALVVVILFAIRFIARPKEIEMNSYSSAAPVSFSSSGDFRMTIEDTFSIKGRGLVVVGRVEAGSIRIGQRVRISDGIKSYETTIKDIESFRQKRASAKVGDNVGLLLADLGKEEIQKGMLLGSIV